MGESYSPVRVPDQWRREEVSQGSKPRGRKPKKSLTEEDEEHIRSLYLGQRQSIRSVVETTGFSLWQVRQVVGKLSRTRSEAAKSQTDELTKRRILALRRTGSTYSEISGKLKLPRSMVTRIIQECLDEAAQKEAIKAAQAQPQFNYDKIIQLSEKGFNREAIARFLGCSVSTIAKARRERGWSKKKR